MRPAAGTASACLRECGPQGRARERGQVAYQLGLAEEQSFPFVVSLSNHELVGNRRAGIARRKLIPTRFGLRGDGWFATSALLATRGQLLSLLRQRK